MDIGVHKGSTPSASWPRHISSCKKDGPLYIIFHSGPGPNRLRCLFGVIHIVYAIVAYR